MSPVAFTAKRPRPMATAIRAFAQAFRPSGVATFSLVTSIVIAERPVDLRPYLLLGPILSPRQRRLNALAAERDSLKAQIAQARRQHSAVCSTERELRAVVTEILSIGAKP